MEDFKLKPFSRIIDWENSQSEILINLAYPQEEKERVASILEASTDWPGQVWVSTSGTLAAKWVALSKPGILASALSVNEHLESTSKDKWVHVLPNFHVGGLGIWARAYLSGCEVFDYKVEHQGKWDVRSFVESVQKREGTLTALVPTQLYDIVHAKLHSPPTLRAVIVGGGQLEVELYKQAIQMGWKILPSYGLTECASQVATAVLGSWEKAAPPPLKVLSHLQTKQMGEHLAFTGQSVLSLYALFEGNEAKIYDPKLDGWFISEDRGSIADGYVNILGRSDSIFKIGGESVDFDRLETLLQTLKLQMGIKHDITLCAFSDERLGFVIHLVEVDCPPSILNELINRFNHTVLPFEKIKKIHHVPFIPRNHLYKIQRKELLKNLLRKDQETGI